MVFTINDIDEAKTQFRIAFLASYKLGESRKDYYCGITNNLGRRQAQHKVNEYLKSIECDSFETASAIENMLDKEGFNVGEEPGHGREGSVFVYMYKIVPGVTCEDC